MGNQNDKTGEYPVIKKGKHQDPKGRSRGRGQPPSPEIIDPKTGKSTPALGK